MRKVTIGNGLPVGTRPAELRFVSSTSLRCPNCNSTYLKKVSLAYQQGLFSTVAYTRFYSVGLGGHVPGLRIVKATTRGFHQSALSKKLSPPVKWSYRKLTLWWVVVFLSIGWILFYISTLTKNSSASLVLFSAL